MVEQNPAEAKTGGSFRKAAGGYAARGFSILPCGPDKKPVLTAWAEFQRRPPAAAELDEWAKADPDANVALVCGRLSDLTVVDCDTAEAVAAVEELIPDALAVPVTTTPRGGRHYHFRFTPGLVSRTTAKGIDVKTEGGYVVDAGRTDKGVYTRNGTPIADRPAMPGALLAFLKEVQGIASPGRKFTGKDWKADIKEGERAQEITRRVGVLTGPAKMPPSEALDVILAVNAKRCKPPLPEAQVRKIVASIARREAAKPTAPDIRTALLTGPEIRALDIRVEWVIDRLIPERSVTLLHGAGGLGKSWLAFAMAKATSEGLPWLGLATRQRPVVYIDHENPLSVFRDKTDRREMGPDFQGWHLSFKPRPPKLDSKDWEAYKELKPGSLLIFDSTRACHSGKGNDDDAACLVMDRFKQICEAGNHDIIALHHTPRANERQAKGSTAWEDMADQVLAFYPVDRKTREELAEGGKYDPGALLYLGTGVKSRFERSRLFVTLDPATGIFTRELDPDRAGLTILAGYLAGAGRDKNQGEIFEWMRDDHGIRKKETVLSLLKQGEREGLWRTRCDAHGAKKYDLLE